MKMFLLLAALLIVNSEQNFNSLDIFANVFDRLSNDQRQQLQELWKAHRDDPRDQWFTAVDGFIQKLPNDQQQNINQIRDRLGLRQGMASGGRIGTSGTMRVGQGQGSQQGQGQSQAGMESAEELRRKAFQFCQSIKAVVENQNLQQQEMRQQIFSLLGQFDRDFMAGQGQNNQNQQWIRRGFFSPIYNDLSQDQQRQLDTLWFSRFQQTRKEWNGKLDEFIGQLPQELRERVEKNRGKIDQNRKANEEKVKGMSQEARDAFERIRAIKDDQTLTFQDSRFKIYDVLFSLDQTILQEFRDQNIHLYRFGVPRESNLRMESSEESIESEEENSN